MPTSRAESEHDGGNQLGKLDPECVTALRRGFEESEAIRTRYPDD